jgi:hypothetical protein
VLNQAALCGREEDCPDRVFRCRRCGYSSPTELDGCPACGADWKAIDVSHGPSCPKNRLEEAMDTPNGALVRRCFRILNAKSIGLTITLADITEEEFRVLELIEAERQEQFKQGDGGAQGSR